MTLPAETSEPPRIRILKASHIYSVGTPIVVLEWRQTPMGAAVVNYWILISRSPCEIKEGRYVIEPMGAEGVDIDLIVDAVQDSCRSWLQSQIADELVREHPNLASRWPVVELKPVNNNVFLSIWMQGKCNEAIETLSKGVRDIGLRHFLHSLQSIVVTKTER